MKFFNHIVEWKRSSHFSRKIQVAKLNGSKRATLRDISPRAACRAASAYQRKIFPRENLFSTSYLGGDIARESLIFSANANARMNTFRGAAPKQNGSFTSRIGADGRGNETDPLSSTM